MRSLKSAASFVLAVAFTLTGSTPASALRPTAKKEGTKSGLEELTVALASGNPEEVGRTAVRLASAAGVMPPQPIPVRPELVEGRTPLKAGLEEKAVVVSAAPLQPKERKELSQRAQHAVSVAFSEGRVFVLAPGETEEVGQFLKGWAAAREKRELEVVLKATDSEKKQGIKKEWDVAEADLLAAIVLLGKAQSTLEEGDVKWALQHETRYAFVLESALPNQAETLYAQQAMGFPPKIHYNYGTASPALYEEGQPGTDSYRSVAAMAGTFPYEAAGKPAAAPRTIYLSVAHLKRLAQLIDLDPAQEGKILKTLGQYLVHLDDQLLLQSPQYKDPVEFSEFTPTSTVPANFYSDLLDLEKQLATLWQQVMANQAASWAKKNDKRVTETFVSVNLSKAFGSLSEIPEQVVKATEAVLESAKERGKIKDFFILRMGDYLIFDVSHNRGAGDATVRDQIRNAVIDGLQIGWDTGLPMMFHAIDQALPQTLDWHEADWRYTERSSQPTLRQVILRGSPKSSDGILFDIYASPAVTTQQPIEGTHGTYWVVENLADPAADRLGFTLPGGPTNKGLFDLLDMGKTSNHATRAVFQGKGSRFPLDEPVAVAFSLGDLQLVVYNSQAGAEAIGGITGPATAPRMIDGQDRRLSLKPVTHEQAPSLTSAKLNGELAAYAPTVIWGTQVFNNGEFDQIVDPIQGPEFASTQLNELRDEFARILLGQGEAQPFLKTEAANARAGEAYQRFTARKEKRAKEVERKEGTLTTGVFKADIGSALGHTEPLEVFMATTRAVLEEAKQTGLIKDYLVKHHRHEVDRVTEFRAGDDIELHLVHTRDIGDPEIHRLAWRAFWAAGWVASDVLKRKPYGIMQDLPNAKDSDAWVEAAMTLMTKELILQNLTALSKRDPRAVDAAELKKISDAFDNEYAAQVVGTRKKKEAADKAKFQFTGNVKGSGIGSAEGYITPGAWSILAFDKASPGAFSVPYMRAAEAALAAGAYTNLLFEVEKVRPEYDKDKNEIPQPPIILDYANLEERKLIQAMLGAVNEFQIKAIRTRDAAGVMRLVAVNSTDRLYQFTEGVYVGKDDPVSVPEAKFASFVFQWMQRELFITEGDERGSHWAFVLPVPMDRSSPGTHSIPIAVGLNFTLTTGGAVTGVVDVFDNPAFDAIRSKAAYYNWAFIRAVGNFGPRGDAASVEATYPLWANIARITAKDSPYSIAAQLALAAGLEEAGYSLDEATTLIQNAVAKYPALKVTVTRIGKAEDGEKPQRITDLRALILNEATPAQGKVVITLGREGNVAFVQVGPDKTQWRSYTAVGNADVVLYTLKEDLFYLKKTFAFLAGSKAGLEEGQTGISRRAFLTGAGIAGAAGVVLGVAGKSLVDGVSSSSRAQETRLERPRMWDLVRWGGGPEPFPVGLISVGRQQQDASGGVVYSGRLRSREGDPNSADWRVEDSAGRRLYPSAELVLVLPKDYGLPEQSVTLQFGEPSRNVRSLWVAGSYVVQDGRITEPAAITIPLDRNITGVGPYRSDRSRIALTVRVQIDGGLTYDAAAATHWVGSWDPTYAFTIRQAVLNTAIPAHWAGLEEAAVAETARGALLEEIRESLGSFIPSEVELEWAHIFDPQNADVARWVAAVIGPDPVVIIAQDADHEADLLASGFGGLGRFIVRLDLHPSIEDARRWAAKQVSEFRPLYYKAGDRGQLLGWLARLMKRYDIPESTLTPDQAERIIRSLAVLRAA